MNKKIKEYQRDLGLSSKSDGKKIETKNRKYLDSLSIEDLKKLVRTYEDGIIPPEVIQVLNNSRDPRIRRLTLESLSNQPDKGTKIEYSILNAISDEDEGIRLLALDMSLSMNIWIKNLKNNRTPLTQKVCLKALNDSSERIRSKAAFYTLKLPSEWHKDSSPIVLAGFAKNPYLTIKDRTEVSNLLVEHKDFRVRYALASNSAIKNPLVIEKLSKDLSPAVRAVLSLNSNKSTEVEKRLSQDSNALVLYLLSISCSHENSQVLRDLIQRVRYWIEVKKEKLRKDKEELLEQLSKPHLLNDKKRTNLERKLMKIKSLLENETLVPEFDSFKSEADELFLDELSSDFHNWNLLHLMGLEHQHLNDSSISISQIIWKCSVKNTGIKEILFWQYLDRILCKPFLLNTFGDNPEIDFLTQITKEEYGRD